MGCDSGAVLIRCLPWLVIVLLLSHFPLRLFSETNLHSHLKMSLTRRVFAPRSFPAVQTRNGSRKRTAAESHGWTPTTDGWMDLLIVNGSTLKNLQQILTGGCLKVKVAACSLPQPGETEPSRTYRKVRPGQSLLGHRRECGRLRQRWECRHPNYHHWRDLLYHNNGNGTFTEVGKEAGLNQAIAWHHRQCFWRL